MIKAELADFGQTLWPRLLLYLLVLALYKLPGSLGRRPAQQTQGAHSDDGKPNVFPRQNREWAQSLVNATIHATRLPRSVRVALLANAPPPPVVGTAGARAKGSVASAKLSEPDRRIEVSRL